MQPNDSLAAHLGETILNSLKHEARASSLDEISEAHRYFNSPSMTIKKCLSGETQLLDSNGELHSLEDLASTAGAWIETVVVDPNGHMKGTKAHSFQISNWATQVYVITMDNGQQIKATADHQFLTPNGEWLTAESLSFGHLLQSATYNPKNKYPNLSINEVSSVRRLDYEHAEPMYSFSINKSDRMFIAEQVGDTYSLICSSN